MAGLIGIAVAVVAILFAFGGAAIVNRWPVVGLLIPAAFVLVAWEFPATPTLATIAGVQIKPEDAAVAVFLIAAIRNAKTLRAILGKRWVSYGTILVCVTISAAMGLVTYGPSAVNEARSTLWLLAAVAWILSVDWALHPRVFDAVCWVISLGLLGVMVFHIAQHGWGAADSFVTGADGELRTSRPLVSGQALVLALCGLIFLARGNATARGRRQLFGAICIVAAVLCQHRSVWVALAAALAIFVFTLRGRALARTLLAGFYSLVILAVVSATGALDSTWEALAYALSSDGTINDRANSWDVLLAEAFESGPWTVIFGQPFGYGFERVVNLQLVTYNPHNWYVVLFLRLGLVGLVVATVALFTAALRLLRHADVRYLSMVLVAILFYAWFYHLPWYIAPWLGIALYVSLTMPSRDQARYAVTPMVERKFPVA